MNNRQTTAYLLETIEAQALHLETLNTLEDMIEDAPNDVWADIFRNSLRLMKEGYSK